MSKVSLLHTRTPKKIFNKHFPHFLKVKKIHSLLSNKSKKAMLTTLKNNKNNLDILFQKNIPSNMKKKLYEINKKLNIDEEIKKLIIGFSQIVKEMEDRKEILTNSIEYKEPPMPELTMEDRKEILTNSIEYKEPPMPELTMEDRKEILTNSIEYKESPMPELSMEDEEQSTSNNPLPQELEKLLSALSQTFKDSKYGTFFKKTVQLIDHLHDINNSFIQANNVTHLTQLYDNINIYYDNNNEITILINNIKTIINNLQSIPKNKDFIYKDSFQLIKQIKESIIKPAANIIDNICSINTSQLSIKQTINEATLFIPTDEKNYRINKG